MKIENTIKIIKEIHQNDIIFLKVGQFYHCYGKDAVIISYLFDYTIKKLDNIYDCGFPITSINKIEAKVEDLKINYLVVNKADNYEVYEEQDFKSENKYIQTYNKAHKYISRKNRITEIYNYLMENINNQAMVSITYFVKDRKKDGGVYLTKKGIIDKIDLVKKYLRFSSKEKINLEDILDITYEVG